MSGFSPEELHDFLVRKLEFEVSMQSLDAIKNNRISGRTFLELNSEDIKEIISLLGERKTIQRLINSYAPTPHQREEVFPTFFCPLTLFHVFL